MNSVQELHKANTAHKVILADTLTPVAMYMRLRDKYPNSILLESNEYGQRSNSYSFICCNPVATFEVNENEIKSTFPDNSISSQDYSSTFDLTTGLNEFKNSFEKVTDDFPFPTNGLFGYLSYDAVQLFEDLEFRFRESDTNNIPLAYYQVFQNVIVFDHYHNQLYVFDHQYADFESKLDEIVAVINHRDVANYSFECTEEESSEMTDNDFKELVEKGKEHCRRGDVFQIVLSRKFEQPFKGDDFNVYRQLRAINPSPYLFYFDYGNFRIFGSSPEAQLLISDTKASIQPIAGTYKRTGNDVADLKAAEELKKDPKETAEHIMLVDLARNDLSRHARDVKVEDYQNIHFYSHVIHMVSKVSGTINENDKIKLIGDTFPAGTLSGAPKYRAMQLIDQYEKSSREFYGGAIGYLGFDGNFNHAIIIRSILSRNNKLLFRAGAGVVVESNLENEMQEVYNKTNALRSAINKANQY
ncbi:anthranilate synthase component 1 [Nonlabens xylanidelens]|uniref:Anthranilate synthase component 1 n=1 Tax=Nonlabens xylanidelens TaxID=191564 RepID=A0A2S6IJH9_9FLAO|nr:anthranilate synthase component I family protein [Nonlabens xylanidelens]PPK94383.1 anthranilate synthase component 1 [Nonlabens xylanidelens]PQJ21454.1 anthranilate synthase component I [Nonlabens xylanidelens]